MRRPVIYAGNEALDAGGSPIVPNFMGTATASLIISISWERRRLAGKVRKSKTTNNPAQRLF
jgi:hypothetical protein